MAQRQVIDYSPQPGPQTAFLQSQADIVIYGGGAGGGKSVALLLEALRNVHVPGFTAVIFRRTRPEITKPGGIWDEAGKIYPHAPFFGEPNQSELEYRFPSKAKIKFAAIQHRNDLTEWQSAQIALIEFDELTTFEEEMFWFMPSRNRTTCGVKTPYIRAGCNPDPDSFVAKLIAWWIDQETGYAIPERCGVIRWFVRLNNEILWADHKQQLLEQFGPDCQPMSLTFIRSLVYDNQILLRQNPGYLAGLKGMPLVERERFLGGNWKIRPAAGKVFNREWFDIVDEINIPYKGGVLCRFFDFAATQKELKKDDPDFTAGVLMLATSDQQYFVLDVIARQLGPADVETLFDSTVRSDKALADKLGLPYRARWEVEPGSAGRREAWRLTTKLAGIDAVGVPARGDKLERARPLATQCQVRNIRLKRAAWNDAFLNHMHAIPDGPHDDIMDATSGAFDELVSGGIGVFV
ncbi:MAG TPA: phage terminase large subunit [Blastocatellia bacterium]|nr:phage terminase large subunit [Blastocatellia bacterium]